MSNQKNPAVNSIGEPTIDLSSVIRNAEYLEPVEPVDVGLVLSVAKQGEEDCKQMSPLSQEEVLERRNIGRNCIPGTNKIDTARRSVSPAEDREATVKTYDLEK